MKSYFIIAVCYMALAGCSGNAVNTSTNGNTAAANAPAAANTSSAANSRSQGAYPQETVNAFIESCESAGSSKTFCTCVLDKVQAAYSFEEFTAIEEEIQAGEPSNEFLDFTAKARAECEKQGT